MKQVQSHLEAIELHFYVPMSTDHWLRVAPRMKEGNIKSQALWLPFGWGKFSSEKSSCELLQSTVTAAREWLHLPSEKDLVSLLTAFSAGYRLHCLDQLASHIKFMPFSHKFSRIPVGQNFWENLEGGGISDRNYTLLL